MHHKKAHDPPGSGIPSENEDSFRKAVYRQVASLSTARGNAQLRDFNGKK
jgi:hypothetical protein